MATTTRTRKSKKPALAQLPAESWGRRLKRGREDVAGRTMEEAIAAVAHIVVFDKSTLSRMESLTQPPTLARQRMTAYTLAVSYGLDPAQFDLYPDDVPAAVLEVVHSQEFPSTKWKHQDSGGGQGRSSTERYERQMSGGRRRVITPKAAA